MRVIRSVAGLGSLPDAVSPGGDGRIRGISNCARHHAQRGEKTPREWQGGGDPQGGVASRVEASALYQPQ